MMLGYFCIRSIDRITLLNMHKCVQMTADSLIHLEAGPTEERPDGLLLLPAACLPPA